MRRVLIHRVIPILIETPCPIIESGESSWFAAHCNKHNDNHSIPLYSAPVFAFRIAHYCPNGPNNRRTVHDQEVVRKQRRLELLLMEQNCVEWVLAV